MRAATIAILALAAVLGFSGCREEGPAERAGKALDRAAANAADKAEEAKDKMKEAFSD